MTSMFLYGPPHVKLPSLSGLAADVDVEPSLVCPPGSLYYVSKGKMFLMIR